MSAAVEIRKARVADAPAILECLRAAFEPFRDRYSPEGFEDTVMNVRSIAARMEAMTLFVAIEDGEVVGTIGCQAHDRGEGHLRGMAVRPDRQGSGVARMLLAAAEADLRARSCVRATLDTTEPLARAAAFYEKCGYRRTGRVSDFFGMPLFEYAKSLR